jgi:hypothetical protein
MITQVTDLTADKLAAMPDRVRLAVLRALGWPAVACGFWTLRPVRRVWS